MQCIHPFTSLWRSQMSWRQFNVRSIATLVALCTTDMVLHPWSKHCMFEWSWVSSSWWFHLYWRVRLLTVILRGFSILLGFSSSAVLIKSHGSPFPITDRSRLTVLELLLNITTSHVRTPYRTLHWQKRSDPVSTVKIHTGCTVKCQWKFREQFCMALLVKLSMKW